MDTKAREKEVERIINDRATIKREVLAGAKKENPDLTDEQLEAIWKQAAHQLGL